MRKDIRQQHPDVVALISYQDTEQHAGTIYKAGNWAIATKQLKFISWGNRKRNAEQTHSPKVRWVFPLRKSLNATCLPDAPAPVGVSQEHTLEVAP